MQKKALTSVNLIFKVQVTVKMLQSKMSQKRWLPQHCLVPNLALILKIQFACLCVREYETNEQFESETWNLNVT